MFVALHERSDDLVSVGFYFLPQVSCIVASRVMELFLVKEDDCFDVFLDELIFLC